MREVYTVIATDEDPYNKVFGGGEVRRAYTDRKKAKAFCARCNRYAKTYPKAPKMKPIAFKNIKKNDEKWNKWRAAVVEWHNKHPDPISKEVSFVCKYHIKKIKIY